MSARIFFFVRSERYDMKNGDPEPPFFYYLPNKKRATIVAISNKRAIFVTTFRNRQL